MPLVGKRSPYPTDGNPGATPVGIADIRAQNDRAILASNNPLGRRRALPGTRTPTMLIKSKQHYHYANRASKSDRSDLHITSNLHNHNLNLLWIASLVGNRLANSNWDFCNSP